MNALVMYDRQTDSLWSQILGEAIEGPLSGATLLFDRRVGGRTFTFSVDESDTAGFVLTDHETGSQWMAWSGAAFDGPLSGQFMERIPNTSAFWFGWKDYHPDTQVFGGEAE